LAGYHNDASGMVVSTSFFDRLYWIKRFIKVYADSAEDDEMKIVDEYGRHTKVQSKKLITFTERKLAESGRTIHQALSSTSVPQIKNMFKLAIDLSDDALRWGKELYDSDVS
jgi:hypothetical protein